MAVCPRNSSQSRCFLVVKPVLGKPSKLKRHVLFIVQMATSAATYRRYLNTKISNNHLIFQHIGHYLPRVIWGSTIMGYHAEWPCTSNYPNQPTSKGFMTTSLLFTLTMAVPRSNWCGITSIIFEGFRSSR